MAHVSYPAAFPVECIRDLIQIVRGGTDEILARKAEVGLHVWNIQGFAQAMLLGTGEGPFMAMAANDEADLAEQCNELASAVASVKGEGFAAEPVGIGGRIDWAKLIAIVKELLPIILPLIL